MQIEHFPEKHVTQEDILYQDYDVCILKPDVKKGVLIFSVVYDKSIFEDGLKTGKQLKEEGIDFGRSMIHNYSFFRAPTSEIETFFEPHVNSLCSSLKVWIRVDPKQTFVYSSEIRAKFSPRFAFGTPEYLNALEQEVIKSRKPMIEYFRILQDNSHVIVNNDKPWYNLFSSRVQMFPNTFKPQYPWDRENININSEVLVRVNILTPNFFVK
jgi:hypothetical protein